MTDIRGDLEPCIMCDGTGELPYRDEDDDELVWREECPDCEGTGFTEPYWDDEE
ncbi:hypothetical protein [Pseudovibrio exalbescens]|uniref:hypothetical protein n=1 Tax=Pseudovibrio exalbescens TaxID=197461 RepID=UPI0015E0A5A7|nr:hypothetical protein [Pseudovibrio exalbescens]